MLLPAGAAVVVSCQGEMQGLGPVQGAGLMGGGSGGGTCVGPTCVDPCEAHPKPGCPCDVEGQHMLCGDVVSSLADGQALCGKGFSVCTGGEWADCIINNAVTLLPDAPPGYYAESLGVGADCTNNPCDPTCVDFVDTPAGLQDAGTNIDASDAGIVPLSEGGTVCVPKSCADQGKNCGPVSDGCGGLLQCGTCNIPKICGINAPSVCGVPVSCTNLCLKQVGCPAGGTTSVTGKVYAPNGTEPLPNAIVYVPNAPVAAFTAGVSCDNCLMASGSPLVSTTTGADGSFTLTNMPVGANIPLVIQIGRWRRQVVIPTVTACTSTAVAASLTRLPRTKAEGDIPKMAFVTGEVDSMECVWRKIGIADSEFTKPTGTGRVHFYAGGHAPGTYITNVGGVNGTPYESTLVGDPAQLAKYDMVLFPCQGAEYHYAAATHKAYQQNLADYANAGGRIFATHYSYIWLYSDNVNYFSPLAPAVNWSINQSAPTPDPQTGYIDTTFAKGNLLASWLKLVGASSTLGQISINTLRRDFNSVNAPTQRWMYIDKPKAGIPQHLTFNTPLGAIPQNQCGRVVFSDLHVENSSDANKKFPTECPAGGMNAQEKLLEYMLFDLSSCVEPDQPVDPCTPVTCGAQGLNCGFAGDGCGATIDCGTCTSPKTCGGGGQTGVCGQPVTYYDGYFVRDYDGGTCPHGTTLSWRLWSWSTITPSDSRVEFTVQTATSKAGLTTAPVDTVVFSNPPGPSALSGAPAKAHAVNVPPGSPDTQLGSALIDATLEKNGRSRYSRHLRVTSRLVPSSDQTKAPILASWDLQTSCVDSE